MAKLFDPSSSGRRVGEEENGVGKGAGLGLFLLGLCTDLVSAWINAALCVPLQPRPQPLEVRSPRGAGK